MKKTLLFILIIVSGINLIYSQENTSPLPNGDTKIGGHLHAGYGNEVWSDANSLYFNYRGSAAATYFWNLGASNGYSLLTINNNGNIGIGNTYPSYNLSVKGRYESPQTLISYDGNNGIFFQAQGNSNHYNWLIGQQRTVDTGLEFTPSTSPGGTTFSAPSMVLKANGNVGIGTTNPGDYKLNVIGKIRADEVVVNTTGADFVFAPGYKLPSLSELESYIKENNHLPDLASANEMKENGMSVSEMQTKLLQKMEEMTLYIIEQNKKNELQNKEIEMLKQKNYGVGGEEEEVDGRRKTEVGRRKSEVGRKTNYFGLRTSDFRLQPHYF